jgi:hypothetical protein
MIDATGSAETCVRVAYPQDHTGGVLEASVCSLPDPKQTGLKLDLERYLRDHDTERAHTARWTPGQDPVEVLGKAKRGRTGADVSPQLGDRTH